MKKFVIAMLMVAGANAAQADYVVKSADGSDLSQLCVAATKSGSALRETAGSIGLSGADLATVRCNGLTLNRFAAKYGKASSIPQTSIGYVLKGSDNSETTALCIAAASSEQEFQRVKAEHFADESQVEAQVLCNGLPLKSFARKYGKPAMTISQR